MYRLLIILFLFPCFVQAQKVKLSVGTPLQTNVYRGALGADSGIYIGSGCGNPASIINLAPFYAIYRGALIYKDTCNDIVYTSNPDESWTALTSGGGGGGSTNSNIGLGYRWAVPNTNNIKTAFPGYGILMDSTSNASGITITLDTTASIFPQTFEIDTTITLDGTVLTLTIPHTLSSLPSNVLVQVDNELGLTTFVPPYFDGTNVTIPYSIGPVGTFEYKITVTP